MSRRKNTRKKVTLKEAIISLIVLAIISIASYIVNTYFVDKENKDVTPVSTVSFDLESIPEYTDQPYVVLNDNKPNFTEKDYTTESFENYSELDSLGRCGVAYANICKEIMPKDGEQRQAIRRAARHRAERTHPAARLAAAGGVRARRRERSAAVSRA